MNKCKHYNSIWDEKFGKWRCQKCGKINPLEEKILTLKQFQKIMGSGQPWPIKEQIEKDYRNGKYEKIEYENMLEETRKIEQEKLFDGLGKIIRGHHSPTSD